MATQAPYPAEEFPWNFYFNGVLMPKWGAQWWLPKDALSSSQWDWDVGHRDVWLISTRLDHVGVVESADARVFLYAVQEALGILLERKSEVIASIEAGGYPGLEVYEGAVSAALQMRRLVEEQQRAFWTSGYEADRLRLVEVMERAALSPEDPRFQPAPHVRAYDRDMQRALEQQRKRLHGLAQSGQWSKEWRRELHDV